MKKKKSPENLKKPAQKNPEQNKGPAIDPQVMLEMLQQKELVLLTEISEKKKIMQIANELNQKLTEAQKTIEELTKINKDLLKLTKKKENPKK